MNWWKLVTNLGLLIRLGKVLPHIVISAIREHRIPDCAESVEALIILREIFTKEIFPLGVTNQNMVNTLDSVMTEMKCKAPVA